MKYQVKLKVFEGPIDLLFHLIEKNKLDIYDIPIAEITRQYLDYLNTMERFDLEIASEFLVMAASLISIKAKMLLPKPPKEFEENKEIEEDPRNDLVEKLIEYKKYKLLSEYLKEREEEQGKIFVRPNDQEKYVNAFSDLPVLEGLTLVDLFGALENVLKKNKYKKPVKEIVREEVTIKDKMVQITDLLSSSTEGRCITFESLFSQSSGKNEIIVQFLALLELVRIQIVYIKQSVIHGEILIFPL
ncbi:MAG: segregation and condensation protein A [Bacillota bacterium]|jgi:segregation and condensation protein A